VKAWLVLSLLLNVAFIAFLAILFWVAPDWIRRRLRGRVLERRLDLLSHLHVGAEDVVFLGDSLTEAGPWGELFPGVKVANRGVSADTSSDVLRRIGQVTSGRPRKVFLMVGTNDLWERRSDRQILGNLDRILAAIQEGTPQTRVYVQSILPRQARYAGRIRRLNEALRPLARRHGCAFIDLFEHLTAPDGSIRDVYSNDGLHLTGAGYLLWRDLIAPYVKE
jgi:lysophospholipase L1-like esterase